MTLWDNGFDLGTDGATASSSTIASSGSAFKIGGTGTFHFTAADAIDGARAIELVRASNTGFAYTNYALNTADVSFSFFFTYKGSLPGSNDYLWDARKGTTTVNSSICRMLTNASNQPFIQIAGVTISTGATAFTVGTQYRCDVRVHISATVGSINVDFYTPYGTTPLFTGFALPSENTGTTNIADVPMGPYGNNTVAVGTFVLDRPRVDDSQSSTYLGAPTSGHTGTASLLSTATLGSAGFVGHAAAVALLSTAVLGASPTGTGTGVTYNDAGYTYSSLVVTYAGTVAGSRASLLSVATLSAIGVDTGPGEIIPGGWGDPAWTWGDPGNSWGGGGIVVPGAPPSVPGVWRTTITTPFSALITVGGSS